MVRFRCGALGDMGCHVLDPVFHAMKLKYPNGCRDHTLMRLGDVETGG
jgi:hypothetical protein